MQLYEYKVVERIEITGNRTQLLYHAAQQEQEAALNKLGEEGWKLVSTNENDGTTRFWYLMREIG